MIRQRYETPGYTSEDMPGYYLDIEMPMQVIQCKGKRASYVVRVKAGVYDGENEKIETLYETRWMIDPMELLKVARKELGFYSKRGYTDLWVEAIPDAFTVMKCFKAEQKTKEEQLTLF